jgi:hypothetical protein
MRQIQIELSTEPTSAKQNAQLYQLWIIDDDPNTPHAQLENIPEPRAVNVEENNEYSFFLHGKFLGATKVILTAGSKTKSFVPTNDGIVKKMGHVHI